MEYFISAIWIGIELLCNIFFCGAFLAKKERSNIKVLVVVIVWIIIGLYSNLGINPLTRQVVTVLLYTFISFLLYKGSYIAHILLALICYIFIATIDTIAVNGMCALLRISYFLFLFWLHIIILTWICHRRNWLNVRKVQKGDFLL